MVHDPDTRDPLAGSRADETPSDRKVAPPKGDPQTEDPGRVTNPGRVGKLVLVSAIGADPASPNRFYRTKGEAEAIQTVYNAIHEGNPTNDLIAIKYLEALQKMSEGQASKIFLPYEATGVLGSIGGIAELLKEKKPS